MNKSLISRNICQQVNIQQALKSSFVFVWPLTCFYEECDRLLLSVDINALLQIFAFCLFFLTVQKVGGPAADVLECIARRIQMYPEKIQEILPATNHLEENYCKIFSWTVFKVKNKNKYLRTYVLTICLGQTCGPFCA